MTGPIINQADLTEALSWVRAGYARDAVPEVRDRGSVELSRVEVYAQDPAVMVAGALRGLSAESARTGTAIAGQVLATESIRILTAEALALWVRKAKRDEAISTALASPWAKTIIILILGAIAGALGIQIPGLTGPTPQAAP